MVDYGSLVVWCGKEPRVELERQMFVYSLIREGSSPGERHVSRKTVSRRRRRNQLARSARKRGR